MSTLQINPSAFPSDRPVGSEPKEDVPPFVVRVPDRRPASPPPAGAQDRLRPAASTDAAKCKPKKPKCDEKPARHADAHAGGSDRSEVVAVSAQALTSLVDLLSNQHGGTGCAQHRDWQDLTSPLENCFALSNELSCFQEKYPFATQGNDQGFGCMNDAMTHFEPLLDQLAPLGCDNGIFELVLPDNQTMGVVVSIQPELLEFLLSPSSDELSKLLQPQQMELEQRLERRIRRNVKITVL